MEIWMVSHVTRDMVKNQSLPLSMERKRFHEIIAPAGKHVNIKGSVKGPNPLAELVEAITTVHDIFLYLSTGAIIFFQALYTWRIPFD
jgi:hypothetical protein